MNKITLMTGGVLLAAAGAVLAQPPGGARFDRDADFTRQQAIERADQRFASLDLDNDGRVTAEEARQARERFAAERRQRFQERLARLTPEQRAEIEQRRAQRQERRSDQAGERRGGRGGGEHRGMRGGHMFGEQGFVTREQMRERALARFDRLDLNRDGTLTADERRQGREHRRERRGRRG